MNEDFLIYIWRYKVFSSSDFKGVSNENIEVISFGSRNFDSGPDFFYAKIKIGKQMWVGNVEVHVNSSDWHKHKHHRDEAFSNVILHVVWKHDKDVKINGVLLPTLELKNYISDDVIKRYANLSMPSKSFLSCSKSYKFDPDFEYHNWIDGLFINRLESKTDIILKQLKTSTYHWEQVLFHSISKAFGLKLNGEAFSNFASSFNYKIIPQLSYDKSMLEALFFGQAGFLNDNFDDAYFMHLKNNYSFLKVKYSLDEINNTQFKFFRTRPPNFPTIRIAQLVGVYFKNPNLFSKIIDFNSIEEIKSIFDVELSDFWENHYTFSKEGKKTTKKITTSFMELVILNAIIPVRLVYFKSINAIKKIEESIELAEKLKPENNKIIKEFKYNKWIVNNAKESQALLHLKYNYCDKNLCLRCLIGKKVLGR